MLTLSLCIFICIHLAAAVAATDPLKTYAHRLVVARWHSEAQWQAFHEIIRRESGWNPCAYYPSSSSCTYSGYNSCGLAQRNPCPAWMRGRLWETRYAQVRDAIAYMAGRYGSPLGALAYWNRNGSY